MDFPWYNQGVKRNTDKSAELILKRYSQMTGDQKIRLGMSLSKMVREVRKAGKIATGA
jgi:hypothetical protein